MKGWVKGGKWSREGREKWIERRKREDKERGKSGRREVGEGWERRRKG
mgnify:CR=1 FL=1